VVLEAVVAMAGAGHAHGNPTLHAVKRRPVHDTLVAIATEAASLLALAPFGSAKVTRDVDALSFKDPVWLGQRYGYFSSPTLGRHELIL
jgi:hypothetical protein